jgi:hypothetical protein
MRYLALVAVLSVWGCGGDAMSSDQSPTPLDGDRPIKIELASSLRRWSLNRGEPPGITFQSFGEAVVLIEKLWNPSGTGPVQTITVDLDLVSHCTEKTATGSPLYSAWTIPGDLRIWVCPSWLGSVTSLLSEGNRGPAGARHLLMHEVGHQYAGVGTHVPQLGRTGATGPVMCAWAWDCTQPDVADWKAEDVALICQTGRGGRCR